MAQKKSRRQRAQAKQVAVKKSANVKPKVVSPKVVEQPVTPYKFPSIWRLSRRAVGVLLRHKGLFAGIIAIYGLLNIVFVGVGSNINITTLRDGFGNRVVGGAAAYTELLGNTSGTNQSGGVYQIVLFLIVSLALVWTLRQVYASHQPRVRDAYYQGMYPLVPSILVILVMVVQLMPALVAATVYQLVIVNGIAASPLEVIFWSLLAIGLLLVSMYFLAASLQAFYIVALPDMTPLAALRAARKLVQGRRWTVLRKAMFMPLALVILTGVFILPVIIVAPGLAQFGLLVATPFLLAFGHSYLYALYRELMHD